MFRGLGNGLCTGGFHVRRFAVAPGNADGGNAVGGGADYIKLGVAYHDHIVCPAVLRQKVGDDLALEERDSSKVPPQTVSK